MDIIDTQGCEFGYEIIMCVPYANYLKVNNKNLIVYSCKDTRCLYYFLDDHEHSEMYNNRRHSKPVGVHFKDIHFSTLDKSQFIFPDFKGYYSSQSFYFDTDKELLIISNKYNKEWLKPPVNFISTETLDMLLHHLSDQYTVIYNRASSKNIVNDNSDLLEFNDYDVLRNHPGVIDANHLYDDYDISFNLFQLLLYSRCDNFISVQGGTSILSSLFGGTNIIFAKNGSEIDCGAYDNWYSELSNCRVLHTNRYDILTKLALQEFKAVERT